MEILAVPCLRDNYAWLLVDRAAGTCAVVDPGEAAPVAAAMAAAGLRLEAILLTHHHPDHVGGVAALCAAAQPTVFAAAADCHRIAHVTHPVVDGDIVAPLGRSIACLATPGHTRHAMCYHDAAAAAVFTGDTLFLGGCGRLFEGSAAQMQASLARLAALPDATAVYCGHEYTARNLAFAATLLPADAAIAARRAAVERARAAGRPTVPAPLAEERATNVFLRAGEAAVQAAVGVPAGDGAAAAAWAALRGRRDAF